MRTEPCRPRRDVSLKITREESREKGLRTEGLAAVLSVVKQG
jgi:hypothetical protein